MARSHSRRHGNSGASAITRSASILHWLGMLAMVVGLFAPLATVDAATTPMTPEQAMMKAAQQPFDRDTTDFDRVVLVGDFQQQVGCGDWDTNCDQTRLVNVNGFWTGVFGVAPGSWNWELIAVDRFGTEYAISDGQVNVSEGQAGIYAEFDSASRDSEASATTGIAFANGMFGDVALAPDGDGFVANALNVPNPGWMDLQVTVNGQVVQTGADFQQGVNRVSFDSVGNITNVEHRGFAEVVVQRMDADGNPLPGSCFMLEGPNQTRGCDTDGSQDGSGDGTTTLRFSSGFQPGDYTLRETRPADGAAPLEDQSVNIQPGQSVVEARSAGEPTPETGGLAVTRVDQDFNLVAGACFELVNTNGEVVGDACDNGAGRTEFQDVPAGDYNLFETQTPDGVEPAESTFVTITSGQLTEVNVQSNAIVVEEPSADEPEVEDPPVDEVPADDEPPVDAVPADDEPPADEPPVDEAPIEEPEDTRVGRIIIYREDEFGTRLGGACYEAVDSGGNTIASYCDEDGLAADDGVTGIPDLPLGDYTVVESRTPDGYEPADPVSITVIEGDVEHTIRTSAVAVVEEPPADEPEIEEPVTDEPADEPEVDEPVSDEGELVPPLSDDPSATLVVNYDYEDGEPVACVEVEADSTGGIIGIDAAVPYACDNDGERDSNPEFGVIEMRSLTPGEFNVVAYQGAAYLTEAEPIPVTLVNDETATVTFERPAPATTSFTIQTLDDDTPLAGACYVINGSGEWICDEGDGPTPLTVDNVVPGDVTIEMVQAPSGYNLADPASQVVPVAADGTTNVDFNVSRTTTSFTIQTLDGETPLAGACYVINGAGDPICDQGDGPTPLTVGNITPGDVTVEMVQAPGGYNLADPVSQVVPVTADGSTNVDFVVSRVTVTVTINTTDGTNPVGGACFVVDGTTEFCDDGSGSYTTSVAPGAHTVTITSAPDDFDLPETTEQSVTATAGETPVVTFTLAESTANLTVNTTDGTSNIAGACYTVNELGQQFCDEGAGVTFEGVPHGDYTVTIDSVPDTHVLTSEATLPVTVGAEGSSVTFTVELTTVDVTVTTINTETGESLYGACYSLDDGEVVCDEGETGSVVFEGETPGEKTLSMERAPEGFEPSADQTINTGDGNVEVGLLQATGTLTVTVLNANNEPVAGACVVVTGGGESSDCLTNETGQVTYGAVPLTTESVTFISAPGDLILAEGETETKAVTFTEGQAAVEFRVQAPPPTLGDLDVTVQFAGDTPQPAEGACVTVSHVDPEVGTNATECDENNDGIVNFVDLPVGGYLVTLDTASYQGPEIEDVVPVSATVEEGDVPNTATLNLQLVPTTGSLQITTLSGDVLVEGTCYTIAGTEICDDEAGDNHETDGIVLISNLEPGENVTVSMTRVPGGYQQPADQQVDIVAGETTEVSFALVAEVQPGTVTVRTVDQNDDPLVNACYQLRQGNAVVESLCDSDPADGEIVFEDLTAGTYQLVQTRMPDGGPFDSIQPRTVEVTAGGNTDVEIGMTLRPGSLIITTVDAEDHSNVLENACYALLRDGTTVFGPFCDIDDAQGVDGRVRFGNVPAGEYTLRQTQTAPGFETADDRTITISAGVNRQITVMNNAIQPPAETGTLVVIPLAPNGEAVPGGCYQVFDGSTPVTHRICDNADDQPARITFENLPTGEFTLRETLAPSPDWQIADDISVTIRNNETTTVEVPHEFKRGHVVIQAVNSVGLPLQGACFMLSDAGDMELCTNSSGQATVTGLVPGTRELTQTEAPFGFRLDETPREVIVRPGQTTNVRVVFENEPPPNTGTVQVQKFFCPAGEDGERTRFLGGAQGNQELKQTAGCNPGVATFTLEAEDGSTDSNAEFSTNEEGRAQLTAVAGIYLLTETDPDLPGNSAARIRVGVGQMTTVIVINYVAPPAPAPVTINVEGYTCPPGFNGSSFVDFANSCMAESQLTNQITVRAEAANRYKRTTGDTGTLGKTAFNDLPAGTYTIWSQRPHNIPVSYLFCGADTNNPSHKGVNGSVSIALESGSTILCRVFQVPPLFDADHGAIQVHKFNCPINERQRGFDWENECGRPTETIEFEIVRIGKTDGSPAQPVRLSTNVDGIVQFPMLLPGTYKLMEVGGEWCFAQSNSVDAQGDVVVQKNKLSEVWVYNCVGTKAPPNTGSGDAAGAIGPDGGITPIQVLPNLIWPVVLLAGWMILRDRKQA